MLADLSTIFSKNTDISAKDRKKAVKGVEIILAALGAELYTDKEAVYRSIDRDYQASDAVETVRSLYGDAKADSLTEDEIDRIILNMSITLPHNGARLVGSPSQYGLQSHLDERKAQHDT